MALKDVGFEYLEGRKGKLRCLTCRKTYKMLGSHLDNHYLSHKENMNFIKVKLKKPRVTQEEYLQLKQQLTEGKSVWKLHKETSRSIDTIQRIRNSTDYVAFHTNLAIYRKKLKEKTLLRGGDNKMSANNRLTKGEYYAIKENHFKGETITKIMELSGRGLMTIKRVIGASSYEDYFTLGEKMYGVNRYAKKEKKTKEIPVLAPTDRWGNIRLFREKLDNVLIDFILGEIQEKTNDIVIENEKLKTENEELKKKLKELEEPNFIKVLKNKLNTEGGES